MLGWVWVTGCGVVGKEWGGGENQVGSRPPVGRGGGDPNAWVYGGGAVGEGRKDYGVG